jgi:LysR family transcriptional regulator, low CO2-responsive transcriptional regulator
MPLDNRISLQKLEVFCLVVELGGVGKAADHLHLAQPAVSAHLRTLQERLGAQLLYRDGRRMHLTEAGRSAYRWAREVLSRSQELVREIEGFAAGEAGSAVIASSMTVGSYLLPPVLSGFCLANPRARLTLHVWDPERAMQATEAGTADFALVITDAAIEQRIFTTESLGHEELVLVASPGDEQVGETASIPELARLRYVCSPGALARRRLVDSVLRELGVQQREIVLELGHPEPMKQATQAGLGVCLLVRSAVERELREGLLREVAIPHAPLHVPVTLVRGAGKRLTPLQGELIETFRDALRARSRAAADALPIAVP